MASKFHAPEDYRKEMYDAAKENGQDPEIINAVLPSGGASFHHGRTFHGSGPNRGTAPRRILVLHCCSSEAQYCSTALARGTGYVYARYKRMGDNIMDEQYFPVLWTRSGYRTAALDQFCEFGHAPADREDV